MSQYPRKDRYWAALPADEFVGEAWRRMEEQEREFDTTAYYGRIYRSYERYYGVSDTAASHSVTAGGDSGQLSLVYVNLYRYFIQHLVSLVAGPRLAYRITPRNSDLKAKEQALLADGLLRGYVRQLRLEKKFREAFETSVVTGEGFVRVFWDDSLGEEYGVDPDTGKVLKTGDVNVRVYSVLDIKRPDHEFTNDTDWIGVVDYVNRYDLASQYPEHRDKIMETKEDRESAHKLRLGPVSRYGLAEHSDLIPVYWFWHKRSPAIPEGRQAYLLDNETWLLDGPLPGAKIPLTRVSPGDVWGTPRGYSPAFDMLGPLEAFNSLLNTALSSQMAFGLPNIMVPRESGVDVHQLSGGLKSVTFDPAMGEPKVMEAPRVDPEILASADRYAGYLMQLLGLNQAALGNIPGTSRLSQDAMAMLDSKALQFASTMQESYTFMAEEVGEKIVQLLRSHVSAPRIGMLIGKHDRVRSRSFVGSDLNEIDRVTVQLANPLLHTPAQKQQQAQLLLEQGMIKSKEEYFAFQETGHLESILEGPRSEMLLVDEENERLAIGNAPPVLATDNHLLHIQEHKHVLNTPSSREEPGVVQATTAHIMEHMEQLRTVDPEVLQILGQVPSQTHQAAQAQQRGEPDPEKPSPQAAPQGGGEAGAEQTDQEPPQASEGPAPPPSYP